MYKVLYNNSKRQFLTKRASVQQVVGGSRLVVPRLPNEESVEKVIYDLFTDEYFYFINGSEGETDDDGEVKSKLNEILDKAVKENTFQNINFLSDSINNGTLLHILCDNTNIAALSHLIEVSKKYNLTLDYNITNDDGLTPMHFLLKRQLSESIIPCIKLILNNSENFDYMKKKSNRSGNTPLHMALGRKSYKKDIIELLLDSKIKPENFINIANHAGNTPLMLSVDRNQTINVSKLINIPGIDLSLRNKHGDTIFDIGKEKNFFDILQILKLLKTEETSAEFKLTDLFKKLYADDVIKNIIEPILDKIIPSEEKINIIGRLNDRKINYDTQIAIELRKLLTLQVSYKQYKNIWERFCSLETPENRKEMISIYETIALFLSKETETISLNILLSVILTKIYRVI